MWVQTSDGHFVFDYALADFVGHRFVRSGCYTISYGVREHTPKNHPGPRPFKTTIKIKVSGYPQ